jgi:hydroxylamine reductase (hybrid-cluster protein)
MERGCLYFGACGKTEETANLQDLLLYILRGIALDIAWYAQKAVGVILALAALGVRRIRIGPTLPAFLQSEGGRRFMDIFATGSVESDLKEICAIG